MRLTALLWQQLLQARFEGWETVARAPRPLLSRAREVLYKLVAALRKSPAGQNPVGTALAEFDQLAAPVFLSYELLHLYGQRYLENIQQQLAFPIATADPRIKDILAEDANAKYFKPIAHHATDDLARHTTRKWK
jgi:hypothetical protein